MRPTALLLGFVASFATTASLFFAACSTGGAPPQEANGSTSAEPEASSSQPEAQPSGPSATSNSNAGGPSSGEPSSQITNEPDGGVSANNAAIAQDGGVSDRYGAIREIISKNRDKYRACFDVWAKAHPGSGEKAILFVIQLDKTGAITSSGIKADKSDIADKTLDSCMVDVTKALTFPPSAKEMDTTYEHPFKFKPGAGK